MRLVEAGWSNYRSLPDARVQVRGHLVLVGPNDSGKSSVLRALHLCMGMPSAQLPAAIEARDFTDAGKPLRLEVLLADLSEDDRAVFPDEIEVGPPETLTVCLEATLNPGDLDDKQMRRYFPLSGHTRGPTRLQLAAIGWAFVPATRSLIRELGFGAAGAVQSLLSTVDLSADEAAFKEAGDQLRAALSESTALEEFRTDLAASLSASLPDPVEPDDLQISSAADVLEDPLAGVTLTIRECDHVAPIADQSDGVRALTVLALLGMTQRRARIVGIDEPETHLHLTAQRSVARSLRHGGGQQVIVTHSPAVVSQMDPLDIVAFGADRRPRQLPAGADIAEIEISTRHWSHRLIEPLTARRIVLVEGPSDRIMCARVAELLGPDLDRAGIAIFELDGSNLFPTAYKVFGKPGFDLPLYGLLDEDARAPWAGQLGVPAADIEAAGYVVCDPDLEAVYVAELGRDRVLAMLLGSDQITEASLLAACGVAALSDVTAEVLAACCGHKKRKVRAALALATAMDAGDAEKLLKLRRLLEIVTA